MEQEEHKQDTSQENAPPPKPEHPQTTAKRRKRREIVLGALGIVVFGIAQFWATPIHKFLCLFVSYILIGAGVYYELRHHSESINGAIFKVAVGVVLLAVITAFAVLDKSSPLPVTNTPIENARVPLTATNVPTRMTLRPGETVDPKDPFAARFTLKNINPFTISNLQYCAIWVDGYTNGHPNENRSVFWVLSPNYVINEMQPEAEADLIFTPTIKPIYPEAISMQVYVYYQPGRHRFDPTNASREPEYFAFPDPEVFEFYARKDVAGDYKWFFADTPIKRWGTNYVTILNRVHYRGAIRPDKPPAVTVELGSNLNPKDPTGQVFIIENQGPGDICNMMCSFLFFNPQRQPQAADDIIVATIDRLSSGRRQSLHFEGTTRLPKLATRTFINFNVFYQPEGFDYTTNESFTYCLYRETNGDCMWAPVGEGQSLENGLKEFAKKIGVINTNQSRGSTN